MGSCRKMIGYCGIDCEGCDAYAATVANDDGLREKTAKLWSKLNHCEIRTEDINCMGCRTDGIKTVYCREMCQIKKCAEGKGFETCGDCTELDGCNLVKPILEYHKDAKDNLMGK